MRVIFWYMDKFTYNPAHKGLEEADDVTAGSAFTDSVVAFIHGEEKDEQEASKVETKLVKNVKWLCGKLQCKKVVLHSFAHLSESKCDPEFLQQMFDHAEERLARSGYQVSQTPYGYFLDINIQAPGLPLARVYKEF